MSTKQSADLRQERRRAFGAQLRSHRRRVGVSQEALADLAGMHRTYVGSVERGERNVSLDAIYTLADALGIEVAEFFPRAS